MSQLTWVHFSPYIHVFKLSHSLTLSPPIMTFAIYSSPLLMFLGSLLSWGSSLIWDHIVCFHVYLVWGQTWGQIMSKIVMTVFLYIVGLFTKPCMCTFLTNPVFNMAPIMTVQRTRFCLFVWFDSLRPINNLSDKQGRVFLGWTSTKLR